LIPQDQSQVFDRGLSELTTLGRQRAVRGRFIALYLGLRRMHSAIAPLGSTLSTPSGDIERFLDRMLTKTHRAPPFVVLTAPFGGSTSPNAPYSSLTGVTPPGHSDATNTWRNNLQIQKGIGCPAEPHLIESLLREPAVRQACPHMEQDSRGRYVCSIENAKYRGEEHSIWLHRTGDGYQVVDLDLPNVYEPYLLPGGNRIPAFALLAVLYSFAPPEIYPDRQTVAIPDFAEDFHFSLSQVAEIFDVDPESPGNAPVLEAVQLESRGPSTPPRGPSTPPRAPVPPPAPASPRGQQAQRDRPAGKLPPEADPIEMNTGLGAERLVAQELVDNGWEVQYRGNQRSVGFDLETQRPSQTISVEVKSSVSFTDPELTQSEWIAAQALGESYVLAIVDFYGDSQQRIWYVRDPAGTASITPRSVSIFRVQRGSLEPLATEAEFL
jgi:hypothetical protein